jgi:hypothetical protein
MRTSTNTITFFDKEDYKNLLHKHLSLSDYKRFINDVNKQTGEEFVLDSKDGFLMPIPNLGRLKIVKYYRPKGVFAAHKGDKKEYNIHTMGYVYCCRMFRSNSFRLYYSKTYSKVAPTEFEQTNFLSRISNEIYNFKTHRMNIKRPLAKILKNNLRDYEEMFKQEPVILKRTPRTNTA